MSNSQNCFNEAQKYIPGGVNSPVRAFKGVNSTPKFIGKSKGAYIYDIDGCEYIDYVGSWGPMILGHNDEEVVTAIHDQINTGISYGAPCILEVELAKKICEIVDSVDLLRFVNSGTEATMSATRLARAYTKRDKIIKFKGCYHGHSDQFLTSSAGSGLLTLDIPNSPGVTKNVAKDTFSSTFNNLEEVENIFRKYSKEIACVIIEPIAGNMGLIEPKREFLQGLKRLCDEHKSLLIFDEVMTGFRIGLTGAQGLYNINPDLTTFGKVIGGGMPIGAFGGKQEIMELVAPLGKVYQAGTLSGHPVAMAAGLATLKKISKSDFFVRLTKKTNKLVTGLNKIATLYNFPFSAKSLGGIFGLFFTQSKEIFSFDDVKSYNVHEFNCFFHFMLKNGVYFAPSAFEVGFMSIAHKDDDIERTIELFNDYLKDRH